MLLNNTECFLVFLNRSVIFHQIICLLCDCWSSTHSEIHFSSGHFSTRVSLHNFCAVSNIYLYVKTFSSFRTFNFWSFGSYFLKYLDFCVTFPSYWKWVKFLKIFINLYCTLYLLFWFCFLKTFLSSILLILDFSVFFFTFLLFFCQFQLCVVCTTNFNGFLVLATF